MFMLVYCARPEDWVPHISAIPLAKITGTLMILAFLFSLDQLRGQTPRELLYLALLSVQLFLSVPFSPVWRGGAFWASLDFVKVVLVIFIMVWVLNTIPKLRRIIYLQTVCVIIVSVITIVKGQTFQGRLTGVLSGNYGNANDLACQIVICVPFCIVFLLLTRNPVAKLAWGSAILLLSYSVLRTGSRAGFFAWALAMAVCIWEFGIRGRYRFLLIFGILGLLMLGFFGGQSVQRIRAISNEQQDATAYASAQARRELLWKSLKITARYPIFGIGAGNFPVLSGDWHVTHNTYTQLSAEAGLPALFLYLMIVGRALSNLRTVKRYRLTRSEHLLWAKALLASLLGFLFASFFASAAFQYFPYILVAYTSGLLLIARQERAVVTTASATIDDSIPVEETYEQGSQPAASPG
jgi:O-antigen ligase